VFYNAALLHMQLLNSRPCEDDAVYHIDLCIVVL